MPVTNLIDSDQNVKLIVFADRQQVVAVGEEALEVAEADVDRLAGRGS